MISQNHYICSCLSKHADPSGAPQNITVSATSPFEADVSWSPPLDEQQNGIITNYVINVTEDATGEIFQESTSNTSHTIDNNLRPYYTYTFEIAAETSVGLGPFSSGISITTHEYGMTDFEFVAYV